MAPLYKGILLKLFSTLAFTSMGALVRVLGDAYPIGQLVFARSFFALLPLLSILLLRKDLLRNLRFENPKAHLLRGVIGVSAMACLFLALQRIALADVTAIGYLTPLVSVVLAALFLGETVRIYRWSAVLIGFLGVGLMLYPYIQGGYAGSSTAMLGAGFACAGALLAAIAITLARILTRKNSSWAIVFCFSCVASGLALLTLPFGWVVPDLTGACLLIATGICGGLGQILMTESFRHAETSVIAPFDYATMIWSVALGYILFSEIPELIVLAGAGIVICAGLFIIWREYRRGISYKTNRTALTLK